MKKNNNKKGFTIVELVIVIAVIAILAAVLIPTFANVIEKANESAALQEIRNELTDMKVAYAMRGMDVEENTIFVSKNGKYAYAYKEGVLVKQDAVPTANLTKLANVSVCNEGAQILIGAEAATKVTAGMGGYDFYANGGKNLLVFFDFGTANDNRTLTIYNDSGKVVYSHAAKNDIAYFSAYYDADLENGREMQESLDNGNMMNNLSKEAATGYYTYEIVDGTTTVTGIFYYAA